ASLVNGVWGRAIYRAARERKLNVLLSGQLGNLTLSYSGHELLPELLRRGRLVALWRATSQLMAKTGMTWRGALVQIFGPFAPVWFWQWINQIYHGRRRDVLEYTAIRSQRLADLDLSKIANERDLDFSYRPRKDGF